MYVFGDIWMFVFLLVMFLFFFLVLSWIIIIGILCFLGGFYVSLIFCFVVEII